MGTSDHNSKSLTRESVEQLGKALVAIADDYPTTFLTERDFFPLVVGYLHGRFPKVSTEHAVDSGKIDFRIGGTNPSVIELAVVPRHLEDLHRKGLRFPGHNIGTQIYASQNRTELKKLGDVPQERAKKRYLLLLDFQAFDPDDLKTQYNAEAQKMGLKNPVCIVHVARAGTRTYTLRKTYAGLAVTR
jgi:hypothetical protein